MNVLKCPSVSPVKSKALLLRMVIAENTLFCVKVKGEITYPDGSPPGSFWWQVTEGAQELKLLTSVYKQVRNWTARVSSIIIFLSKSLEQLSAWQCLFTMQRPLMRQHSMRRQSGLFLLSEHRNQEMAVKGVWEITRAFLKNGFCYNMPKRCCCIRNALGKSILFST